MCVYLGPIPIPPNLATCTHMHLLSSIDVLCRVEYRLRAHPARSSDLENMPGNAALTTNSSAMNARKRTSCWSTRCSYFVSRSDFSLQTLVAVQFDQTDNRDSPTQVSCLSKVLQQPEALTVEEQLVVRNLLDPVAGLGSALDSDGLSSS